MSIKDFDSDDTMCIKNIDPTCLTLSHHKETIHIRWLVCQNLRIICSLRIEGATFVITNVVQEMPSMLSRMSL